MVSAPSRSPDELARANRLAAARGLPFPVVADNLTEFEETDHLDKVAAAAKEDPAAGWFLGDSRRASLVRDDLDGTTKLARALRPEARAADDPGWFEETIGYIRGGFARRKASALGILDALDVGPTVMDPATGEWTRDRTGETAVLMAEGERQAAAVERTSAATQDAFQALGEANEGGAGNAAAKVWEGRRALIPVLGQSIGQAIDGMALTVATGGGSRVVTAGVSGTSSASVEYGASLMESIQEAGADPTNYADIARALRNPELMAKAKEKAAKRGLAIGTFDAITAGVAGHFINNARRGIRSASLRVGAEVATQTAGGSAGELAAQGLTEDKLKWGDVLVEGVAGLPFSAVEVNANYRTARNRGEVRWINERIQQVQASIEGAGNLAAVTEAANASKLPGRSPVDAEALAEAAGAGDVYLRADQAQILFQSEPGLLAELVGGEDVLAEQIATGDLVIPMAKWVSRVASLPNVAEIQRQARTEVDGLSPAEIEGLDVQGMAREFGADLSPEADAAEAAPDTRQAVQDDVYAQLVATNRYTPAAAQAQAQLWGAAFGRFAEISGQDPQALYQRYMAGVSTEGAGPAGRVMNQGGIGDALQARMDAEAEAVSAEYDQLADSEGGRILNTDLARELSPEYRADRTRSADVHEAASAFVKRRYAEKLAQPTPEGMDRKVMFTAGGTGAGKTTALRDIGDAFGRPEIVYDTNMNTLGSARQKVEQALDAGREVLITYVFRDPVEALTGGAIPRAQRMAAERGTGRTVPLAEHAKTHAGVRGVMDALAQQYADDARVQIVAIDNTRGRGNAQVVDLESLPQVEQNSLHGQLAAALEEARSGGLDDAIYRGFAADGRGTPPEATQGAGGDRNLDDVPGRDRRVQGQDAADGPGVGQQLEPERSRELTETPPSGGVSASGDGLLTRMAEAVRRLFQPASQAPRGQISIFPDQRMSIALFENADRSTFLHESAHFFLEVYRDLATGENANPRAVQDMATLLDWFGVDSADAIGVEQHEQFARGFEAYLGEGKAPSPALQAVFAQFRAWVLGIYKALGNLNVTLTDDVRGVFDRMLASDIEIDVAQSRQGASPIVRDVGEAKALGLTEKQFLDYEGMLLAATEEAKADLTGKLLKQQRRAQEAWWKEERAAIKAEVAAALAAEPVHMAARELSGAETYADGLPIPPELRIRLSKAALSEAGHDLRPLRGLYAEGGVDLDTAAALLGVRSGDELVQKLSTRGSIDALANAEADARMTALHGDLMTDGTLPAAAMDAVHNTKRVQALEFELGLLARLAGQPAQSRREIKAIAQQAVEAKTARKLKPNEYLAAERRAATEAAQAAAKGDYAAALLAKRRQAFNASMFSEARARQARNERQIRALKKAATDKTRKRVGKSGKSYVDALDALLEGHEFRPVSERAVRRRTSLAQWVDSMQEAGNNTAVSEELLARVNAEDVVNVADLTGRQLDELHEAVRNLLHLARTKNKLLSSTGERRWKEAKAQLIERLQEQVPKHGRGGLSDADRTLWGRIMDGYAGAANWMLQPETLVEWMDGGTTGPFHDLIWNQSEAAEAHRNELRRRVGGMLKTAIDALPKEELKALDQRHYIASMDENVSGHSILSALLNMGNASNRDKLTRGGRVKGDEIIAMTDEQLAEMFSKLSASQATVVQGIWDATSSIWPDAVALEERMNGFAPERIEPLSFTVMTKDGPVALRGGYFPVKYDPAGARAAQFQEDEAAKRAIMGQVGVRATTSKGHTKTRTDYVAPLLLDWNAVLTTHLDGVMSDIAYRQFLSQAQRVLKDPDIRRMADARLGPSSTKYLLGAMERGATGSYFPAGMGTNPLMKVTNQTMVNASVAALGFRVPLAIANIITAPILASARVHPKHLISSLVDYYGSMAESTEAIHAMSPKMLKRSEARSVEYAAVLDQLRGKRGIRAKIVELSFVVHQWVNPLVERAIWMAAYRQAQAGGASMQDSISAADKVITQTQTKSALKDLSEAESNPYLKPLMMFAGPLVIINNRLQEAGLRGQFRGAVSTPTQALGTWIAMAAGGAWLFELMMGRGPDDEDDDGDEDSKDWMTWAARQLAMLPFAGVPGLRDAVSYLDKGYIVGSHPLTAAAKRLVDFGKKAFDDDAGIFTDEPDLYEIGMSGAGAASVFVPIPANQLRKSGDYLMEVGTGEHTPENPAADAYYLLQGPPKD